MTDADRELSGPDFTAGIEAHELAEGALLLGHAQGEALCLARRGGQVFAIGATCTHYGGPLAEGLLVGDTVRCPWHHACFSLHSGEALSAPALKPVPCFDVLERDGRVRVLGRRAPARRTAPGTSPRSIVIVGAGAAGHAAAEALRREGYAGSLTLCGADEFAPYDRPNLSKDYLAGHAPEGWLPLAEPEFYDAQQIVLRLGTRVESLDLAAKSVRCADGTSLTYDALLLATGADPIRLALPGGDLPHVRYLRTLADSRALIARSATARRAVVVGAGFIGLEVASSLRARGLEVAVVAPDRLPLARVLGDALGAEIQHLHEEHGVTFRLGRRPVSISDADVALDDGTRLPADLVVLGVGVRPTTALAEAAGLAVDRGIVVDAYLRTSAPDVYAAGDNARWPDARTGETPRVEHWVVAERQGQVAALNMLGLRRPFAAVPFFWSAHYDVTIAYVGHAEAWERIDQTGSLPGRDCALAFRRGDRTLAIATIGRDRVSLEAEAAMEQDDEALLHSLVP